jgi:hypothetical protein
MISSTIARSFAQRMRVTFARVVESKARAIAVAAAVCVVAGCGTKDAADPLQPTGPQGRIRFVNLITDPARNPVNAILEGVPFGVNLAYTATTPASLPAPSTANYSAILAGDRSLVLKRTADTTVTVATLPVTVAADADYTVFATGGAGGSAVTGFTYTDVNTAVMAGQTRVRVVNMSPTGGALDVFLTAANADLAAATPVAAGLTHRGTAAYFNVAPGTYQLRAVPAGTTPAARAGAVSITLNGVVLAAGTGRTIVTADNTTGGAPLRAFVLSDQ